MEVEGRTQRQATKGAQSGAGQRAAGARPSDAWSEDQGSENEQLGGDTRNERLGDEQWCPGDERIKESPLDSWPLSDGTLRLPQCPR